jgi:putative salt-induced outer membrane protein YdiY
MRGWDSNAELGLNGSDGNADTLAIQTGFELKRKSAMRTLAIDFDYRLASSRNHTVEENGHLNIDCDRFVRGSDWAGFGKFGLEWDRFKAFDLRLNLNGGFGYHWIRRENATLVTRFGAGGSREIGAPDDAWIPEATFGIDAERQLTSRQKLKAKVDYFPALRGFGDFRLVSDIAWEVLLDGSDNLSLKIAATDRYDSTPQGAKPNDVYYSVLLLRKF